VGQYFGRRKTQLCTLPISNPLCIDPMLKKNLSRTSAAARAPVIAQGTSATVETPANARTPNGLIPKAKGRKDYLPNYSRLIKIKIKIS
jgi:hypothetical protein